MGNEIPTTARRKVADRDGGQCQRCGGASTALHHRRRRNTRQGHDPHCTCILISLCYLCHTWVHANPAEARNTGFIITSHEPEPWGVPFQLFTRDLQFNDCHGGYRLTSK